MWLSKIAEQIRNSRVNLREEGRRIAPIVDFRFFLDNIRLSIFILIVLKSLIYLCYPYFLYSLFLLLIVALSLDAL